MFGALIMLKIDGGSNRTCPDEGIGERSDDRAARGAES